MTVPEENRPKTTSTDETVETQDAQRGEKRDEGAMGRTLREAIEDRIVQVERHFGAWFPRDYPGTTGSLSRVPPADDFLVIDALDELIGNDEAGEFQRRFPGAVVVGGDGSREPLAYDFREETPPLVTLDVSTEDWLEVGRNQYHAVLTTTALAECVPEPRYRGQSQPGRVLGPATYGAVRFLLGYG
ncbi:hypothetical protein [Streptomyces cinereoruber]|uniref:hypothetical protein n=1 Tax=Streptomyces cinereoruber TaxID=67260 RepID=UPI003C2F3CA3